MLKLNQLKKQYGKNVALKNVSLNLVRGRCYGLVGPNGAGKTTLLKIIASIIQDYQGSIEFNNSIRTNPKELIGYIPQEICLEESVTGRDNLSFFGKIYGLKGQMLRRRIDGVLKKIGLTDKAKQKVTTYSGGMKRRLNIGCALLHQPELIIMDEPTVGIDPQSRRYIFNMIETLKENGCTIIYASHYMEEIEQICDEAIFIDKGAIAENDRVDVLLQKYAVPSIYLKGEHCLPEAKGDFTLSQQKEGHLLLTDNPLQVMERVITHCKEHAVQPEQLELSKARLEDVFFSLTGSQLRN
ncbi:ABC transporter ATP-binding protein [Oceanobacillus kapialis]|uniref:ABC transporter ATP-binding protein n=1 Tax=Oceanobacillus kapialis TaxID=481353 RepID=A0ABW5Q4R4_9BACI